MYPVQSVNVSNERRMIARAFGSNSHALFLFGGTMKKLLKTILARVRKKPFSFQTFEDLYYMCKEAMKEDTDLGVKYLKLLSTEIEKAFRDSSLSEADIHKLYDLHVRSH